MIPYVQLLIKDSIPATVDGKQYMLPVISGFQVSFINPNMYRRFECPYVDAIVKDDAHGDFAEQDLVVGVNRIIRLEAVQPSQNDKDPTDVVYITEEQLKALVEILGPPQDTQLDDEAEDPTWSDSTPT